MAALTISASTVLAIELKWVVVLDNQGVLWASLRFTLLIGILSFFGALILGMTMARLRMSRWKPVALLAAGYINVFRAMPGLVFIIYVYYGVSIFIGYSFHPITAAILVLTMEYAAWLAEIFRGGIMAVPMGQTEAGLAIGMSRIRAFLTIVLPQMARIVFLPVGNTFVSIVKDSSLASIIGVFELLRVTQSLVSRTFRPFELYTAAVVGYLLVTLSISFLVNRVEKRYRLVDPLTAVKMSRGPLARRRHAYLHNLRLSVVEESDALH